jgi:RnfABCDGE-type electron transport complex B subunit
MLLTTAVATLGGLTLVLVSFLAVADRKLAVVEDVRIRQVEEMLPHTNCGGCGYPGCLPFAEALVAREVLPGQCTVSSNAARQRIARFLGVEVGAARRRVARLACAGGSNVARVHATYKGLETCAAAAAVAGGGKGCVWGCLGLADCEVSCDFDAISMNRYSLPVVDEALCTACGDCVEACPKDLFSLHDVEHRLWVACRSLEAGDAVLEECEVGCTACAKCAMDGPGVVTMSNNLPVIDYSRDHSTKKPIARCPTGAIVWIEADGTILKGAAAHRVVRQGAAPAAAS